MRTWVLALVFLIGAASPGAENPWALEKRPGGERIALGGQEDIDLATTARFLGLGLSRRGETLVLSTRDGKELVLSAALGMGLSQGRLMRGQGSATDRWTPYSLARALDLLLEDPVRVDLANKLLVVGEGEVQSPETVARGYQVRRIVLDAGHGGKDPGAIGPTRFMEKQANLDIALRTRNRLREIAPGLEVLLTRDKDVFIPLDGRTRIANRDKADLFVSIHCNASKRRKSQGSEVYTYSASGAKHGAGNGESNDRLVRAILSGGTHEAWKDRSKRLGVTVLDQLQDGLKLNRRLVKEMDYFVLRLVDMPAILVEVAYLSNPQEEARLKSSKFRAKVAELLADAIVEYRDWHQPQSARRP